MSEEQGKSEGKWYKGWKNCIFLLMILLPLMLFIVFMFVTILIGVETYPTREFVYNTAKAELQNAVNDYQDKNNGTLPTINGAVTINNSDYKIVNICSLLASQGGTLQYVPDGCICINGSDNDNCDASCEGCYDEFSYIWAVDDEGNVYSTCVGEYCNASGIDGFQGFP